MSSKQLLLAFFLLLTSLSFSQGISVQGIARDNSSSAITNTNLTFTFSITKDDNSVLYAETQLIKTDNFGVFSHIISTGNPVTNTFNAIDFEISNLKLKVSVNYNGSAIEVYNQTLQSTPYAHYAKKATLAKTAANGVPTGSIMPFIGTTAPAGWVLCNGQSLNDVEGAEALRALVGTNAPDLQGMFLRGTGTNPVNSQEGPTLKGTQGDSFKSHTHTNSVSETERGNHQHNITKLPLDNQTGSGLGSIPTLFSTSGSNEKWADLAGFGGVTDSNPGIGYNATNATGNHTHSVSVTINNTGDLETRPVSYGVNYIIKL